MADDIYSVLGVARTAKAEDITKAYRKLAKKLHPDLNPGNKKAEQSFKEVSAAYDLLSDPAKKLRFDRGEIDHHGGEGGASGIYDSQWTMRGPAGMNLPSDLSPRGIWNSRVPLSNDRGENPRATKSL
jgi:curved DNA-binding protein CbpA